MSAPATPQRTTPCGDGSHANSTAPEIRATATQVSTARRKQLLLSPPSVVAAHRLIGGFLGADPSSVSLAGALLVSIVAGLLVLGVAARVMQIEEVGSIAVSVKRRVVDLLGRSGADRKTRPRA